MTTVMAPLCVFCKHLDNDTKDAFVCKAFPKGIPQAIIESKTDHRQPHFGDGGVRFEKAKDAILPDYFKEIFG